MLCFGVNTVYNRAGCVKYMYRRCRNRYFTPTYSRYALNGASCSARPPAPPVMINWGENESRKTEGKETHSKGKYPYIRMGYA